MRRWRKLKLQPPKIPDTMVRIYAVGEFIPGEIAAFNLVYRLETAQLDPPDFVCSYRRVF